MPTSQPLEPEFLTLDEVLDIHNDQISRYGGKGGIRDHGVLLSAIEAPRWAHQYGETDLVALAAVYLFHLVQNHAFIDGNKRVGTAAALVFLDLHDCWLEIPDDELEQLTMDVAQGQLDKEAVAEKLRQYRS